MKTYKVLYTTSADDFKEVEETIVPTLDTVDFMDVKKEEMAEIVADYEKIPSDVELKITNVERIELMPGELPFALKSEEAEKIDIVTV